MDPKQAVFADPSTPGPHGHCCAFPGAVLKVEGSDPGPRDVGSRILTLPPLLGTNLKKGVKKYI